MNSKLQGIFRSLDINTDNGLALDDNKEQMTTYQQLFFSQAKEKIGIDAVYFLRDSDGIAKIPLIYFSAMDGYDPQKIAELHRLSWNMGEAPLLFIVTPDVLRIYNNYELPRKIDGSNDGFFLYFNTLKNVLNNTIGRSIICESHYFIGESPLAVLSLSLEGTSSDSLQLHMSNTPSKKYYIDYSSSMKSNCYLLTIENTTNE